MIRQAQIANLPSIGRELVKLGFPGDAVPLFQEALALADMPEPPASNVRLITEPFDPSAVRKDLDRALDGMDRDELAAIAAQSIASAMRGRAYRPGETTSTSLWQRRRATRRSTW